MQQTLFERAKAEDNGIEFFENYLAEQPVIISLFDYSGTWSEHYRRAGFRVLQIELKFGFDILTWNYKAIRRDLVKGVLAAPPCTDFAVSGAQYWPEKDKDGRTEQSLQLIKHTLEIVDYFQPVFWAIENPVGRLNDLLPQLSKYGPWYFHPFWYGDAWSKKTGLWGVFNRPAPCNIVEPLEYSTQGSWLMNLGGKSERTKELRSITPKGFAKAFYDANSIKECSLIHSP